MDRLRAARARRAHSLPARRLTRATEVVDRVFWYALGRPPSLDERRAASRAIVDPDTSGPLSPEGLADLLWAVMVKPEFQLIYLRWVRWTNPLTAEERRIYDDLTRGRRGLTRRRFSA